VLAVALLAAALLSRGARAQDAPPALTTEQEQTAHAAMSRLRSPYTASHTVDMCPSAGALRDSIRVAAATGQSTDQIVEDVIARHGERLRLLPKRTGPGLWAWLAPPLLLVVGATLIAYRLRRSQAEAEGAPAPAAGSTLTEEERGQLAAALRDWDRSGPADE
jgi:cytochrome c-type biogenesis protein CcmH/NrfF